MNDRILMLRFRNLRLPELLGFHLCESCLKLNEDCRKKVADENAKERLKGVTENVEELKLIIRTTDELVDAITNRRASAKLQRVEQSFDKKVGGEQTRNQTMVQFI